MRLLSLLFDPRGAIDRRAFWSGLLQLLLVSAAVCAGLSHVSEVEAPTALAVLPVLGEAAITHDLAGRAAAARLPDAAMITMLLVVAARFYATACLCLKRLRDAGRGPGPLIAVGVWSLAVHAVMSWWTWDLWDREMAVILPLYADVAITALTWTIFLMWLGTAGRPRITTGAWA